MRIFLIAICMFWSSVSYAGTVFSTHTGSYLGFAAVGLGLATQDKSYTTHAVLGYVPALIGGEDLWSLTLRGEASLATWKDEKIRLYGGGGFIASFDADTFVVLPAKYPAGYYPSTGLFFTPYIGTEWMVGRNSSMYFEVASLDFYLELFMRNPDYLKIQDIATYGVGYRYYLP